MFHHKSIRKKESGKKNGDLKQPPHYNMREYDIREDDTCREVILKIGRQSNGFERNSTAYLPP